MKKRVIRADMRGTLPNGDFGASMVGYVGAVDQGSNTYNAETAVRTQSAYNVIPDAASNISELIYSSTPDNTPIVQRQVSSVEQADNKKFMLALLAVAAIALFIYMRRKGRK